MKTKYPLFSSTIVSFLLLITLLAPWIAHESDGKSWFPLVPYSAEKADIFHADPLDPPSKTHWMGTDYVGRDVLSRLIHGVRNSLLFSLVVVFGCLLFGICLGALMGYSGGKIDLILSRFMEIIGNFPIFLLQLTLLAIFDQSYSILFFVMFLSGWIPYCRLTRGEVLKLRNQEFIQAARVVGASPFRVFFRHLIPNSLTPILIFVPFSLSSTIAALGALSFLGFGEPINVASLGELLKQAKDHFQTAWWLALFPGGTVFLMTLSLTLLGSRLRDLFDPKNAE